MSLSFFPSRRHSCRTFISGSKYGRIRSLARAAGAPPGLSHPASDPLTRLFTDSAFSLLLHSKAFLSFTLAAILIRAFSASATCPLDVRPERPFRPRRPTRRPARKLINSLFPFPPQAAAATSAQMGLANIGGVFIVVLGGMIVSCLIAVVEYAWGKRMLLQDENVSWAQGTASHT